MKRDNCIAVRVEDADILVFQELASTVGSIDQMMKQNSGKMPKRDLLALITQRNKAAVKLEKFVAAIYQKYDLDDRHIWAFDPMRGEVYQLPQQRPLWRFR